MVSFLNVHTLHTPHKRTCVPKLASQGDKKVQKLEKMKPFPQNIANALLKTDKEDGWSP